MTVAQLINKLNEYPGDCEVVTVRNHPVSGKMPESVDAVYDGGEMAGYDKEFAGKVVIW